MFDREHRTLAYVPRWAIIRVNRRQSVAEHSFYVAMYAFEIAKFIGFKGSYENLLSWALTHDMEEIVKGDPPSSYHQITKTETSKEWVRTKMAERSSSTSAYAFTRDPGGLRVVAIVKLADIVESLLYLGDEENSGNGRNVCNVQSYLWEKLNEQWKEFMTATGVDDDTARSLSASIAEAIYRARLSTDKLVHE